jgi:tripartite ATP-independent transporter DctP family solute receptor
MKKYLSFFTFMALIGIFVLGVLNGSSSAADKKIVKLCFGQTIDHPMGVGGAAFASALAKRTNNRFSVQLFPLGTLGSERENVESVQMGALQVALVPTGFSPIFAPDTGLTMLPYLFKSREHCYKALDGAGGEELSKTWPKEFKVLGYYENAGARHVTNSVRPIKVPEDYKGLKIRVMDNQVQIASLKKLGAGPTPMTIGEVYMALQQKVIDGQENPLANIYTTKFYEVQKYCSLVGMFMDSLSFVVNAAFFNGISKEDQTAFIEAMKEGREAGRKFSTNKEQEYLTLLKAKGMEINQVNTEPFFKALRPVWDEFIKTDRQRKIVDLLANPK